jgi:hypothetical protein
MTETTPCPYCDADVQTDGTQETHLFYNLRTSALEDAPVTKLGCMWCGHVWYQYDNVPDYYVWIGTFDE